MINLLKYKFLSSVNINLLNKNYEVYAFILFINLNFFYITLNIPLWAKHFPDHSINIKERQK